MEYRDFAGMKLSRMMVGTVQFGMNYGIANKTGQPSLKDVCAMIACAYEGGVNCLDTARLYGTSEEVIGEALAELGLAGKMTIVTKIAHVDEGVTPDVADRMVEESVRRSLKSLRLDALPLLLVHHEENFCYMQSLIKLKERGLVRHVGCSVMTPQITKGIVASGLVEAVQVPTSVLDRRYVRAGVFHDCRMGGLGLFVRSMYLQGLVLMNDAEIAPELAAVPPVLQKLRALAAEAGITLAELAARYVLGLEGVTCGVVGVETLDQVRQNVAIFNKGALDAGLMKAVVAAVPDLPDAILMPNKWSKK